MNDNATRNRGSEAQAVKALRIEEAIFGKYISEPGGPFVGKEYGFLSRSSEFPEDHSDIESLIRDVESRVLIDPDQQENGMVFGLFDDNGFWGVQIRLQDNATESGAQARASIVARVRYLPDVSHWGDLPPGLLLNLVAEKRPETVVRGHPKEIAPFWYMQGVHQEVFESYLVLLKDSDVLLERFTFLNNKLFPMIKSHLSVSICGTPMMRMTPHTSLSSVRSWSALE
ncbi:MAG: hypothetical protein WA782_12865 [Sulfitobacter sp.]